MKKLYLLLANGLVLFAGVGTLTLSVAGCNHKKKDDTTTKIYDALNKFTEANPLEIPYQTETPTAKVSDPAITKAVKDLMKTKVPAIFTDTVLDKIKFDNTHLKVGEAVAVKAIYNNDQKKAVPIYIKERTIDSLVYSALKKFTEANPLEISYQTETPTAKVSDPAITKAVKDLMKAKVPDIFTKTVLDKIKFDDTPLKVGEAVAVKATYNNDQEKAVTIFVKEPRNTPEGIYDALKEFTKANLIEIPYQEPPTPTPLASDPAVASKIKSEMTSQNPIFTKTVLDKIKFDDTPLKVNEAVPVKATYNNDQEKAVTIFVLEQDDSIATLVINILKKYNADNPVKIDSKYGGKFADDDTPGTFQDPDGVIRIFILKQHREITADLHTIIFKKVTFSHTKLKKGESVGVTASYGGKSATIFVFVKVK